MFRFVLFFFVFVFVFFFLFVFFDVFFFFLILFVATCRVALQTRELWLVGRCRDRPKHQRHACVSLHFFLQKQNQKIAKNGKKAKNQLIKKIYQKQVFL